MNLSIWFQTKFTSICNSISAISLHRPVKTKFTSKWNSIFRQNLHQHAATDLSKLTYPRVQTKIYINMLSYKPTYPRVQTNLSQYATVFPLQAYIPQSAGKIYMNMQQYLSYKPTYPRVQTNFISICSNSISTTSLQAYIPMHMHSADPINSFSSLTKNSARNQQP